MCTHVIGPMDAEQLTNRNVTRAREPRTANSDHDRGRIGFGIWEDTVQYAHMGCSILNLIQSCTALCGNSTGAWSVDEPRAWRVERVWYCALRQWLLIHGNDTKRVSKSSVLHLFHFPPERVHGGPCMNSTLTAMLSPGRTQYDVCASFGCGHEDS